VGPEVAEMGYKLFKVLHSAHDLPPGRCYSLFFGIIKEWFSNITHGKDN